MERRIKVKEALALAASRVDIATRGELAELLWPGSDPVTARTNLNNLINGRVKRFTAETVSVICRYCDCSPDFLFEI